MHPLKFAIYDFMTRRPVSTTPSYEQGFDECIRLYRASGCKRSYFVQAVAS